ncbi:alpha-1,4-glucan--maltose-1-phosphate maltosyltransferase [Tundrisphaera lichenicola]|uniref:alpha-1,4-glucan--maltose-1-phosphate maltosyltransferase n=1 Tax=Tundrisphaera lichenicola TaxID=2029860 RepID=UPI003EB8EA5B
MASASRPSLKERTRERGPAESAPSRIIIEGITPEIDGGAFPIKRVVGEGVIVEADIFAEGHDHLRALLKYRPVGSTEWSEIPMTPLPNDRWTGSFTIETQGRFEYTVEGWVDRFASWAYELGKKAEAGQDVQSELLEGAELVREGAKRAVGPDVDWLKARGEVLGRASDQAERVHAALDPKLSAIMARHPDRSRGFTYERNLGVTVERVLARTGAWYELFPRSTAPEPGRHGTFKTTEARLPYVASMGFDVVYFPPIHPVGRAFRKGPNNTLTPGPDDPGSPWAIGSPEGGHKAVLPELGTLEDFDHLVATAKGLGLEIALDIAFQCSPDHPYVKDHPQWFRHRPDGTIKYAENPPKKYQDIYPIDFECEDWRSLYEELRDVFLFWVDHGVTIFRVDNPHTKPFRFWDWVIREVWDNHPDTIFLAEAFTRPKLMARLAKGGFPQSYSYFTWRNDKASIQEYFTTLTQTELVEYMRPNLFANTPDILHEFLQHGGPPAFQIRLVLAATLGSSYGIYGPPFEQSVGTPWKPGSEEYLDSEKYQVRHWNLDAPGSHVALITRINQIRRENPALHSNRYLRFIPTDNDRLIAYLKTTPDLSNMTLVVVNLDPYHTQSGWVRVPFWELGIGDPGQVYQVHDLISDARYLWQGEANFVQLDPNACPAHVFRIRRKIKTEHDFDYFE